MLVGYTIKSDNGFPQSLSLSLAAVGDHDVDKKNAVTIATSRLATISKPRPRYTCYYYVMLIIDTR